MQLHNVRYGFATNSSSSHSVILAPGLTDKEAPDELGYGWEKFILASEEEKRRYLFTAAVLSLRGHDATPAQRAKVAYQVREGFPVSDRDVDIAIDGGECEYTSMYIDHQSMVGFPRPRREEDGMTPLWKFLDREIAQQSKIVIAGGNDNCDNEAWKPHAAKHAPRLALWKDLTESASHFLFDEKTGHLTIFNGTNGKKVRIIPDNAPAPKFAAVPELVDVKITDYCPVGCTYCYQGSTKKGKHGDLAEIQAFARRIGAMGVFEVAIGGGDPTTHPHFPEILKAFHDNGVVPNFSTQLWDWFDDERIVDAVKRYCGAVALSTQNVTQAEKFFKECKKHNIRAHIHYVLGLKPLSNLQKMLKLKVRDYYGQHLVLLAYKEMGRATGTPPVDYTGWQQTVRDNNDYRWSIAVDSFLVDDVRAGFSREEVPAELFESSDGRFSLYWDA
ncbi:MAG: radical SAM protein, partial [Nitrospiraceae bacterium]